MIQLTFAIELRYEIAEQPADFVFNVHAAQNRSCGCDINDVHWHPTRKFEIVVTILAHVEGGSTFGAETPRHNGR